MSFQDLVDQTHLLTSSLILHLYEGSSIETPYNKKKRRSEHTENVVEPPKPSPQIAVQKKLEPPKTPEKVIPKKVIQPEESPPPAIHTHSPFIQTLSQAMPKTEEPYLNDIIEKMKQFGGVSFRTSPISDLTAQEGLIWKKEYPHFALVSFFAKNSSSEQFLQKVVGAVSSRLAIPTIFFTAPSFQTAAELSCFASSGILKAVVFAHDLSLQQKAYEWLGHFPLLEQVDPQEEISPLAIKKKLFSSSFYQLVLPPHYEQALDFKATLWKALQQIL